MWIDTNFNGERRMFDLTAQKQLGIERFSPKSSAWKLRLGSSSFGSTVAVFATIEEAVAEYENICAAISAGLHYYKVKTEEVIDSERS